MIYVLRVRLLDLKDALNDIIKCGGTIMFVTQEKDIYTVIYKTITSGGC